ncbi:MAG: AMP-binding protein [Streptosporangiales bacterium]|nr:AMP-binding protein [Streptosporangiales bacterium]
MREFTAPDTIEIDSGDNLAKTVARHAAERPDTVLFRRKLDDSWQPVTAAEFNTEVRALAKGLVANGILPGDRVALMASTSYEWTLVDYAVFTAGAVTVPVYDTSSQSQVDWIVGNSGAKLAFAQTPALAALLEKARGEAPALSSVWTWEDGGIDEMYQLGEDVPDDEIDRRIEGTHAESIATLVYTSGTTGRPKGCELTHLNLLSNARSATSQGLADMFTQPEAATLLFLPLAHVFARIIEVFCVENAVTFGHCKDMKNDLIADLGSFRPTFILAVPRVFEKVFNSAASKATLSGKGKIFDRAAGVARDYSKALDTGGPGVGLKVQHALFDRLVYGKLRDVMGGRVMYAVSGGGPLAPELAHFFRGIGLRVLEGYGLTETSPVVSVNLPADVRIGTVGRPIGGTTVRIADDGEILVKGPQIFTGYWQNDEAAKETFDEDGWFKTGDLGDLDADGYLRITGRKKEIIVTAGGKNVSPSILEDRMRMHPVVSQCMVVGDNKPYIGVLVTLDAETLPDWLKARGKEQLDPEQAKDDPDVQRAVQVAVDDANTLVSKAEAIKRFRIVSGDWTLDGGELTAKLSLKRKVVMERMADDVEELYT